jgi:hypothetical protein
LSERQAHEAHANGETYSVLVDSLEKPFCVILVMANAVVTDFLDEHLRPALSYHFQVISPGRMFLTMAIHREFNDEAVAKGTRYTFTEEGTVNIRRETFSPVHNLETVAITTDVSSNYAAVPKFGEYEVFMRRERQLH